MDITAVLIKTFGTLFSTYWWLIPLLFLIAIFSSPFMKGVFGELIVNLAAKFFWIKKYHPLQKCNATFR